MGWSGATFTLLYDFSAFRDANPGAEYIDADDVDEQFTDIKGGLEALLLRDGSNSPSGNIDWNGQLITNLGAPTAAAHAARRQEVNKAIGPAMGGLTEYTIASGVIIPAGQAQFNIDTQSDAASDDLDTITPTNYTADQIIMIRANDPARTVVVKHGTGNINTLWGDDINLDSVEKWMTLRYDGTDFHEVSRSPDIPRPVDEGQIFGLEIGNNAIDSEHDIDVSVGHTVSVGATSHLRLTSGLTKRLDASWAVGNGSGGLDTGSVAANTPYGVWLVKRSDTGVVDVLFSTGFTTGGVTLPPDYDSLQLIGWVHTDSSSNIYPFTQKENYFEYEEVIESITDSSITANIFETGTLDLPPNCLAQVILNVFNTSTGNVIAFGAVKEKGSARAHTGNFAQTGIFTNAASTGGSSVGTTLVPLNSASQIEYLAREESGSTTVRIFSVGCFFNQRGRAA